jgi:hypothetical protein
MKRWPLFLVGALFLVCDLVAAGLVYDRLDPGAAHAALRRLNLDQQATSTPAPRGTPTLPLVHGSSTGGLVSVHRSAWSVAKWHPGTRVEMGVGDAFTWPDHRNARRQYLIVRVYEANHTGSSVHFASSARDLALSGSNRTAYGETPSFFSSYHMPRMQESKDLPPGGKNVGGIAFDIPIRRRTYMILWKERKSAGWLPVAKVAVGPGHKPIVSPAS